MKKFILITLAALSLTACTTMQDFSHKDLTAEGIRFNYGAADGVKVGDKIKALKKIPSVSRRAYSFEHKGTLTVTKVEQEYSIMKKDSDFEVDKMTSFTTDK